MKKIMDRVVLASGYLNPIVLSGEQRFNFKCIRRVAPSVLISHDHKFVYCRVAKAANTTMLNLLYESIEGGGIERWSRSQLTREYFSFLGGKTLFYGAKPLNDYFFFTFVRNPYDRILSAYLDKFKMKTYQLKYPMISPPDESEDKAKNFNSFLRYLSSSSKFMFSDHHWVPQFLFMLPGLPRIDYVGKVETLVADYEYVCVHLELPFCKKIDSDFRGKGVSTTSSSTKHNIYYSEDAVGRQNKEIVRSLYRRDFTDFGYEF